MSTTSLVDRVRACFAREKPELAERFDRTFTAVAHNEHQAQVELNRYLRIQLVKAPVSTVDERDCLVDDISAEMWFKYFESHVLRTMVRFDLPQE